jgi:hypothetical protein
VIPALLRPRQQDLKFKGSLGYIARLSQNKTNKTKPKVELPVVHTLQSQQVRRQRTGGSPFKASLGK